MQIMTRSRVRWSGGRRHLTLIGGLFTKQGVVLTEAGVIAGNFSIPQMTLEVHFMDELEATPLTGVSGVVHVVGLDVDLRIANLVEGFPANATGELPLRLLTLAAFSS